MRGVVMATNASDDAASKFQPSEDWIDEFAKQCTDRMRQDLREYAQWRAHGVRRMGGNVSSTYADEMVADAIADTLCGVVDWRHERKPLYQHLEDTIKYRTRHHRKHAEHYKHDRLDAPESTADRRAARGLLEASMLHDRSGASADDAIFAGEVLDQLRALAASDPPVLHYLNAIVGGAQTRAEIMEATGMPMKTFRNARDRLGRLVDQLDQQTGASRNQRGVRA
jgi:hypothetical protein